MILSPIRILCGASDCSRAWASVLQAMNSTPIISARIIRLTALLPPPPTPMTRMRAKFSESDRSGIGAPPVVRSQGECIGRVTARPLRAGPGVRRRVGFLGLPRSIRRRPPRSSLSPVPGRARRRRRARRCPGAPREPGNAARKGPAGVDQPARKLSRTVRGGVVLVGVEQRDRLPRPESQPAADRRAPSATAGPATAGRGPRRGPASRGGGPSGRRGAGAGRAP